MTLATPIRRLLLLTALAVAALAGLAKPETALARVGETIDQGVVQSVSATSIAVRRLDATVVTVDVGPTTTVRLNGRAASILDVPPGAVARVAWTVGAPARLVQAVGTPAARNDEGVILVSAARRLVLRTAAGETVIVRLGPLTVVRRPNGAAAARRVLRPGATVRASHVPGKPALTIVLLVRA